MDVFVNSQYALRRLREGEDILNLIPFIEADGSFDASDFYLGTMDVCSEDGGTWAIPASVDPLVMFYNRGLFDQHGPPYPTVGWTWDDFLAAGVALTDAADSVFGYGPHYEGNAVLWDPLTLIYQDGGKIFDDLQDPTRSTFDDPLAIDALEWYSGVLHKHDIAPTPELAREAFADYPFIWSGVQEGRFGMWTGMLSDRGGRSWPREWTIAWGVAPLPRDAQRATLVTVDGYYISVHTQHPQECWRWVAFLSTKIPNRDTPARKSLAESYDYQQLVGGATVVAARSALENPVLISSNILGFGDSWETFEEVVDRINNGYSTAAEAMHWAQQQAN